MNCPCDDLRSTAREVSLQLDALATMLSEFEELHALKGEQVAMLLDRLKEQLEKVI